MGILADSVLERGGKVTGVIPESIARSNVAHTGLTELLVVSGMHERKQMMIELSDGFIALPGGYGTFDEFFDVISRLSSDCCLCRADFSMCGIFRKAPGIYNTAVEEGFLKKSIAICSSLRRNRKV